MAFSTDDTLWREFLQVWPLERLREMTLAEYTTAGDKDCFVYWLEFRLVDYGSIAGGSAFKFAIFSARKRGRVRAIRPWLTTTATAGTADSAHLPKRHFRPFVDMWWPLLRLLVTVDWTKSTTARLALPTAGRSPFTISRCETRVLLASTCVSLFCTFSAYRLRTLQHLKVSFTKPSQDCVRRMRVSSCSVNGYGKTGSPTHRLSSS